MTIITSAINALVFIEILDNFLIPLIENWSSDDDNDEVIFPDDNVSCHRAKRMKAFPQEMPENCPDLNPSKNLRWKFFKDGPWECSIHQRRSINCH